MFILTSDEDGSDVNGWLNFITHYCPPGSFGGNTGGILEIKRDENCYVIFKVSGSIFSTIKSTWREFSVLKLGNGVNEPSTNDVVSIAFLPSGLKGDNGISIKEHKAKMDLEDSGRTRTTIISCWSQRRTRRTN